MNEKINRKSETENFRGCNVAVLVMLMKFNSDRINCNLSE